MHFILLGILLGLGAAIPIGPMNLEIMRRNLRFGTPYGIVFGCGVSTADLIYLLLIATGAFVLLQHPAVLKITGVLGSLILAWFGIGALRLHARANDNMQHVSHSYFKNYWQGLLMTLVSPFTIIFWASVSSHIIITSDKHLQAVLLSGLGVMMGTFGWAIFFNTVLHFTRHKLSERAIHYINILGGIILLAFALFGLIGTFYS